MSATSDARSSSSSYVPGHVSFTRSLTIIPAGVLARVSRIARARSVSGLGQPVLFQFGRKHVVVKMPVASVLEQSFKLLDPISRGIHRGVRGFEFGVEAQQLSVSRFDHDMALISATRLLRIWSSLASSSMFQRRRTFTFARRPSRLFARVFMT